MADQPKQKEEGFKVVDRRHFTAEGERRQDVVEEEIQKPGEATAGGKAKAPQAPPSEREARKQATPREPSLVEEARRSVPAADFSALVASLYRSAVALLGGFADPETGQAIVDLDGARHMIDLIDVLAEKTAGNLTQEEARMLREVKAELKLAYLNVANATAQALKEKAKTHRYKILQN